uniref:Reverse transcriptase Ty1/copia-type domain-containing protein n=1 Tax=Chenopodium quinoa TaxID=63459 RepID=A0A803LQS3_CHEQI
MGEPPENNNNNQLISMEQMEQMFQMFQKLNKNPINTESGTSQTVRVAEKLNFTNYTKWCKLMQIAISGRGRLNHITANPVPPDDPEYAQWAQRDSLVLSWIIENIDGDLVNQFLDYKHARDLWKGIETLLSSGRDELQTFDLNTKAASLKQGSENLEVYFSKLNTLWKEIDRRMPNPMKCSEDITLFNSFIQRQRLYQFLAGVNDSLDKEKRDLLNQDPLPSIDAAYAFIRREIARRGIMTGVSSPGQNPSEIGSGLVANRRSESSFRREDKSHLKCTHCGGTKHTKKGCFEIIGYPEWWEEYTKKKAATKVGVNQTGGRAHLAVKSSPTPSRSDNDGGGKNSGKEGCAEKIASMEEAESTTENYGGQEGREQKMEIGIENGKDEARTDALTGRIIGRGTERGGLYYVDEVAQQGNALLAHGSPENQLWMWHRRLEAIATSTYLTNRLPSKPLDYKTPLDTLSSHVTIPSVHSLPPRVFGCVVYVHLPKRARNKLEPRAVKCVFIGYGVHQKGYRCYDPIQKRVYTTLDCEFFEQTYYYTPLSPQGENLSDDLSWLTYPEMVDPDPTTQVGNTTDATPAVVSLPLRSPPNPPNEHPSEEVPSESSPVSYNMPEINPVSNESEQNRYELPPRSTRGVPPRRYDPEYEDQRSRYPIERISTENLSSTAIAFNASLYSADIPKNVEEAVKNEKWKQAMEEEQSNSDHTLFLKKEKEKITCLIIYVDDMIITGNDEEEIADLKGKLFQEFEMKDLGNLKYFLGIEVLRSKQGIFIHQRKYILDLLAETGMLGCKPAETPIVANHGLQILEGAKLTNKEEYQKIVGKLIYLAHTRPDIAYAVGVVSRFMHLPQVQHMTAIMRILRYLKGTSSTGIYFDKNDHLDLIAYTDADWAGDRDGRKSTSGYFTLVGGNLVTWRSKKQKVVALSSAEAEFRGASNYVALHLTSCHGTTK